MNIRKFAGFVTALALSAGLYSCGTSGVDYSIAERYFVKNTVTDRVPGTISSKALFDEYFGAAALMGEGGLPTEIDFSKQCVIPIDKGITDIDTSIEVVGVDIPSKNHIRVCYRVKEGDKLSFTMRPCVLVLVDSKYSGYDLELKVVE